MMQQRIKLQLFIFVTEFLLRFIDWIFVCKQLEIDNAKQIFIKIIFYKLYAN